MTPLIKAMIYGDSGSGKTYFIGTATQCEETSPVLVLNARGQPVTFRLFDDPPLVVDIEEMGDFNAPYDWVLGGQPWERILRWLGGPVNSVSRKFAQDVVEYSYQRAGLDEQEGEGESDFLIRLRKAPPIKFKTIAVDSITWTQRISLNQIVGNVRVSPGDMPQATQIQHWGRTLAQLTNLADLYYHLPIHVILTALTRHNEIPAMGLTMFYPFVWGQSSLELPSLAEIVGRMVPIEGLNAAQAMALKRNLPKEMETAWNVLLTKGGRNFMAKWQGIRTNPSVVVNPTISKVIEVMETHV